MGPMLGFPSVCLSILHNTAFQKCTGSRFTTSAIFHAGLVTNKSARNERKRKEKKYRKGKELKKAQEKRNKDLHEAKRIEEERLRKEEQWKQEIKEKKMKEEMEKKRKEEEEKKRKEDEGKKMREQIERKRREEDQKKREGIDRMRREEEEKRRREKEEKQRKEEEEKKKQLVGQPTPPELLKSTAFPSQPWQYLAADLMGPLPSGEYVMVVVDIFSRYFEVDIMRSITATKIIDSLDKVFCTHGLPVTLRTDNGPQFMSE